MATLGATASTTTYPATAADVGAQPADAELTAIAGLTSAADKGIMFTGAGTAAVYPLTSAGLALLDDAAASNQRTTLGLGTAAVAATGDFEAAGGIATHAGAADPHTGYRLESADHSHASTGLQAGQVDHGALGGLGDDDHPQYATDTDLSTHEADTTSIHGITNTANLYAAGGTDVAVADGGTGASTAAAAKTNLGIDVHTLNFVIDGGGSTITTGVKGDLALDYAGTITAWTALADQSGSIVVDIWRDSYANFPPTVADTITGAEKPTISAATKGQDTSLASGAGWAFSAGDILRFNVDSITTCTRVTISLKVVR